MNEDKIRTIYDQAVELKEIARKSVDNIEFYIQAAERAHEAGRMSVHLSTVEKDIDLKIQHEVFAAYYFYEEHDCLSGYYYEKHDTKTAKEHARQSKEFISNAISLLENIPPEVSPKTREFLAGFLPSWNHCLRAAKMKELASKARAKWDSKQFVEALDFYRQMARVQKDDIEKLDESLDPKYRRIAVGNFIGFMTNASTSMAQIMLKRVDTEGKDSLEIPFDTLVKLLKYTLDAYLLGNAAFHHNPEWEQYYEYALNCLRQIQNILKSNPSLWLQLYVAFEDNPEFLKIMKMIDINKFKETERERHLQENKLLKLWGVGSFWLLALVMVVAIVLFIQSYNLTWWRFALIITAIEVILILIGAFTLRTIGDLSEENFLKLIGMAFKYQFGFFRLFKKRGNSK
jgi:tetratricopeptide (TPR) repeat protein